MKNLKKWSIKLRNYFPQLASSYLVLKIIESQFLRPERELRDHVVHFLHLTDEKTDPQRLKWHNQVHNFHGTILPLSCKHHVIYTFAIIPCSRR